MTMTLRALNESTKDASLTSADGVFSASGIEAIKSTYQDRFAVLGQLTM